MPTPLRRGPRAGSRLGPLDALDRVLRSVEAVRDGRSLFVLLGTFATAGLLLAMAESALARDASGWGIAWGGLSLTAAFYGSNAAGLLSMDAARGRPQRDVLDALVDALHSAHRLLAVLLVVAVAWTLLLALVCAGLWTAHLPRLGPWLFGLMVPLAVVLLGAALLTTVTVVGPLAAPSIWAGSSVRATLGLLTRQTRHRLVFVALLMAAVGALTAVVGALVSFVVASGARAVAALAGLVAGVDLPPQQLMAGLFGYGLRSLGAAGAPVAETPYGAAALVGGGVVFALALVLPGLVYLRGVCAVYLALAGDEGPEQ